MWTARCSANAVPATAWPGLRPPVIAQSGTTAMVAPAAYDQRSASMAGSHRSIRAPSDWSRRVDFVDDLLEHLVGLEDGRHPRRDLAQRLLRVGAPGDLGP